MAISNREKFLSELVSDATGKVTTRSQFLQSLQSGEPGYTFSPLSKKLSTFESDIQSVLDEEERTRIEAEKRRLRSQEFSDSMNRYGGTFGRVYSGIEPTPTNEKGWLAALGGSIATGIVDVFKTLGGLIESMFVAQEGERKYTSGGAHWIPLEGSKQHRLLQEVAEGKKTILEGTKENWQDMGADAFRRILTTQTYDYLQGVSEDIVEWADISTPAEAKTFAVVHGLPSVALNFIPMVGPALFGLTNSIDTYANNIHRVGADGITEQDIINRAIASGLWYTFGGKILDAIGKGIGQAITPTATKFAESLGLAANNTVNAFGNQYIFGNLGTKVTSKILQKYGLQMLGGGATLTGLYFGSGLIAYATTDKNDSMNLFDKDSVISINGAFQSFLQGAVMRGIFTLPQLAKQFQHTNKIAKALGLESASDLTTGHMKEFLEKASEFAESKNKEAYIQEVNKVLAKLMEEELADLHFLHEKVSREYGKNSPYAKEIRQTFADVSIERRTYTKGIAPEIADGYWAKHFGHRQQNVAENYSAYQAEKATQVPKGQLLLGNRNAITNAQATEYFEALQADFDSPVVKDLATKAGIMVMAGSMNPTQQKAFAEITAENIEHYRKIAQEAQRQKKEEAKVAASKPATKPKEAKPVTSGKGKATPSAPTVTPKTTSKGKVISDVPEAKESPKGPSFKPVERPQAKTSIASSPQGLTIESALGIGETAYSTVRAVDTKDLLPSMDADSVVIPEFPKELQDRDVGRVANRSLVNTIAQQPDFFQLTMLEQISEGMPVVSEEGYVIAGNHRIAGILKMQRDNPENYQKYKEHIVKNAQRLGLNTEELKGDFIAVRVLEPGEDLQRVAGITNKPTVSGRSATEVAISDAKQITSDIATLFAPNDRGSIDTAGNRGFVKAFVDNIFTKAELNQYVKEDGSLSIEGINRIENAMFYKAYGSELLLKKIAETPAEGIRRIKSAMMNVAGRIMSYQGMVEKGEAYDVDVGTVIGKTVENWIDVKNRGEDIQQFLKQVELSPTQDQLRAKNMLAGMEGNMNSIPALTEYFGTYVDAAIELGNPKQPSLLGMEQEPPTMDSLIRAIVGEGGIYEIPQVEERKPKVGKTPATKVEPEAVAEAKGQLDFFSKAEKPAVKGQGKGKGKGKAPVPKASAQKVASGESYVAKLPDSIKPIVEKFPKDLEATQVRWDSTRRMDVPVKSGDKLSVEDVAGKYLEGKVTSLAMRSLFKDRGSATVDGKKYKFEAPVKVIKVEESEMSKLSRERSDKLIKDAEALDFISVGGSVSVKPPASGSTPSKGKGKGSTAAPSVTTIGSFHSELKKILGKDSIDAMAEAGRMPKGTKLTFMERLKEFGKEFLLITTRGSSKLPHYMADERRVLRKLVASQRIGSDISYRNIQIIFGERSASSEDMKMITYAIAFPDLLEDVSLGLYGPTYIMGIAGEEVSYNNTKVWINKVNGDDVTINLDKKGKTQITVKLDKLKPYGQKKLPFKIKSPEDLFKANMLLQKYIHDNPDEAKYITDTLAKDKAVMDRQRNKTEKAGNKLGFNMTYVFSRQYHMYHHVISKSKYFNKLIEQFRTTPAGKAIFYGRSGSAEDYALDPRIHRYLLSQFLWRAEVIFEAFHAMQRHDRHLDFELHADGSISFPEGYTKISPLEMGVAGFEHKLESVLGLSDKQVKDILAIDLNSITDSAQRQATEYQQEQIRDVLDKGDWGINVLPKLKQQAKALGMKQNSKQFKAARKNLLELSAKGTLILPVEVVSELRRISGKIGKEINAVEVFFRGLMKWFQYRSLRWPDRAPTYNIRNIPGDLVPVWQTAPELILPALKHVPQLIRFFVFNEVDDFTQMYIEEGGMLSGEVAATLHDIGDHISTLGKSNISKQLAAYKEHVKNGERVKALGELAKFAWKEIATLETFTEFREQILRYGVARAAYELLQTTPYNIPTRRIGFGASLEMELKSLSVAHRNDPKRAALLISLKWSADMIGDYPDVSIAMDFLSDYTIAFGRFREKNPVRQSRLFRNAFFPEHVRKKANELLRTTFANDPDALAYIDGIEQEELRQMKGGYTQEGEYKTGGRKGQGKYKRIRFTVGTGAGTLFTLLSSRWLWRLVGVIGAYKLMEKVSPEKEEMLPQYVRDKPHFTLPILGGDKSVTYVADVDALFEILEMFDIDYSTIPEIKDVIDGHMSLETFLTHHFAKSPFEYVTDQFHPLYKMPLKYISKRDPFPDPENPRVIRNLLLEFTKDMGFELVYKALSNMPKRDGNLLGEFSVIGRKAFADDTAMNRMFDLKDEFYKEYGISKPTVSVTYDKMTVYGQLEKQKADAVYYYKMSLRSNDYNAAKHWLEMYITLGGSKKEMNDKLKSLHPLNGLSKAETRAFGRWISAEDMLIYNKAAAIFEELLELNDEVLLGVD